MDPKDLTLRLHDVLRDAYRVRLPGPGCTAEASLASVDAVKVGLRGLLADLGEREPPRLPARRHACAAAMPEGRIAGTRATVQHRRRTRGPAVPGKVVKLDTRRAAAEAVFAPVGAVSGKGKTVRLGW